jgi:hypothetical protein
LLISRAGAKSLAPSIPILFFDRLRILRLEHNPKGFLPIETAKTSDVFESIKQLDKSNYSNGTLDNNFIKNGQFGSF